MRLPVLVGLSLSLGLSACANLAGPSAAPSCDGSARRPLNRSLWDWEGDRSEASPIPKLSIAFETRSVSAALLPTQPPAPPQSELVLLSSLDIPKSFRLCSMDESRG
jgi:hypothetical protein